MRDFRLRDFRRLPPFLRVLVIVGYLLLVVAIVLLMQMTTLALPSSYDPRLIGANLAALAFACFLVVNVYCLRFRQPATEPFPFSSWQSQVRASALMATLPLCALGLLFILPAGALREWLIVGTLLPEMVILFIAYLWTADSLTRSSHLMRIRQWHWAQ